MPTEDAETLPEIDLADIEAQRAVEAIDYILNHKPEYTQTLLNRIFNRVSASGVTASFPVNTPYKNTIPSHEELPYPGDLSIERRLLSYIRWNAMAMVVKANRNNSSLGGHISTFASSAIIYEVGFNHIFKGHDSGRPADLIFFQGHASPGNYSRSFLEGRLSETNLNNFRQDLAVDGGLSSYPHPYLMPTYWQFPTVSMGLGPIMSIYQARFIRYLRARNLLTTKEEPRVYCFVGDGEIDEPETLGALAIAARENLDNLTFIVNCNLQRLDGPVRGNGKVIQELEGVFRGAHWNVIKVIWGSNWDQLLQSKYGPLILKRMEECVDGEFQKYTVSPGSYIRKHFFGKYPELKEAVNNLTDAEIKQLLRGGHDPVKVYNAYMRALKHKGQPSVILAKTVKGYGLGEAGEGKNISHQQKKLNEKELREFKVRFDIPITDEEISETPFYKPKKTSPEIKYLLERRKELGGFLPERRVHPNPLPIPDLPYFEEFFGGSGDNPISTTMGLVRILTKLIRDKDFGKHIVPIIPDEARTFGMEALFRQIGIYSPKGQLYEPVDSESLLYYKEATDGQILEEGINEAGAMCSFIAAGTSYANFNVPTIPFFIYYSMFGFQRIGDLMWLAGDIQAKGFLVGGTAGRTTLNGEGLQHQDGHSHLIASTIPNLVTYDPTYRYEIAVIIQDGLRRMYKDGEEIFYYLTVGNENYDHRAMPKGVEEGIIRGLYRLESSNKKGEKVHLFGSGPLINEVFSAKSILEKEYGLSVDVWSATSYKRLRTEALNCQRWNMLHPKKTPKKSYLEATLEKENGIFVAVSDNMKVVSDQISSWVPGGLFSLGTDGFGRSGTREDLRSFFEVNTAHIVVATLYQLFQKGKVTKDVVDKAIKSQKINPEKVFPICVE